MNAGQLALLRRIDADPDGFLETSSRLDATVQSLVEAHFLEHVITAIVSRKRAGGRALWRLTEQGRQAAQP